MDKKLTKKEKFKLFIKKYWFYFLIALCGILGIIASIFIGNKNNFLFDFVKNLVERNRKVNEQLNQIRKDSLDKEDKIRHETENKINQINNKAENQQNLNLEERKEKFDSIVSNSNDKPEQMANDLSNVFGIPVDNSHKEKNQ